MLAEQGNNDYLAPHFVYAVRREAGDLLEGEELLDTGGLRIITTLDYEGYQRSAEKWAQIAYDLDRMSPEDLIATYGEAAAGEQGWIRQLQGRNINNDAMVTVNYRTGAVLAYVGSANFFGESTPEHQPNFDVIGQAYRQSGSAFKPITYAAGFESGVITPATMLMDVQGEIVDGYSVPNADNRERGPVRVRDALKYSLNIPVAKIQQLVGTDNVVNMAERLGLDWDPRQEAEVAVPSLTLGTIGVHMLDLATAYGVIANAGEFVPSYMIERIEDSDGNVIYDHATDADESEQVLSPQSAYLVTDILADNTDPAANPLWGPRFQLPAAEGRRPATLKTGTTNDFRDLQAVGYLAADPDPSVTEGAIVTGVWVGNSDFSAIQDVFAADGPTFIWHDYMAEVAELNELPVRDFTRPDGRGRRRRSTPSAACCPASSRRRPSPRWCAPTASRPRPIRPTASCASRPSPARSGRRAVATSPPRRRRLSPDPSAEPPPSEPLEELFLDLVGWEEERPPWEEANTAWIEEWTGREDELNATVRSPFPGPIDTSPCTNRGMHAGRDPDLLADPVADAVAHADPGADARADAGADRRCRRQRRCRAHRRAWSPRPQP